MNIVGVIGSFAVGIVLIVLSYFTLDEGYVWLIYLTTGILLAAFGAYLVLRERDWE